MTLVLKRQNFKKDVFLTIIFFTPKNKLVSGDIPSNVLRSSEFIFSYLTECINKVIRNSKFQESLELSDIVLVCKRRNPQIDIIFDQSSFCLLFHRFLKKLYLINYATI